MFVEGSMFFGNDRLPLVEHELAVGADGALEKGSGAST
jgi:hypothetical protein